LQLVLQILNLIGTVVWWLAAAAAALLILRVIVAWAGSNPFLWLPYQLRRVTEPMVRPLRPPFSGYPTRFELIPLVAAVMVLMAGWFTADIIWRLSAILDSLAGAARVGLLTTGYLAARLILLAGALMEAFIFLRFLLPWFGLGYSNKFMRFLFLVTEPLLKPLRRLLGNLVTMRMFDFTPLIALILVRVITFFLASLMG